jgi:hypothetical protein
MLAIELEVSLVNVKNQRWWIAAIPLENVFIGFDWVLSAFILYKIRSCSL